MPSWFDRFGQEWASVGLTDDPTYAQADAGWAYIGQAPPTVEQFNSMFQWSDDKDNWLFGQIGSVIAWGGMVPDPDDPYQLLKAIQGKLKIKLSADFIIWCDAVNGNDSTNTGAQNSPFRTIQHAFNYAVTNIELASYTVIVQLAPGTYEPCSLLVPLNGLMFVNGDVLNPRAYLIKNTNGPAVLASHGANLAVQGISVEASGVDNNYSTVGMGLFADTGGIIMYNEVAFGPCSNAHIATWSAAQCAAFGNNTKYTIYGGANFHISSYASGCATNAVCAVTIQNNPHFGVCFALGSTGGMIQAWSSVYSGTCTGVKARADNLGIVNCNGVSPDVLFPGDAPAAAPYNGGIYI